MTFNAVIDDRSFLLDSCLLSSLNSQIFWIYSWNNIDRSYWSNSFGFYCSLIAIRSVHLYQFLQGSLYKILFQFFWTSFSWYWLQNNVRSWHFRVFLEPLLLLEGLSSLLMALCAHVNESPLLTYCDELCMYKRFVKTLSAALKVAYIQARVTFWPACAW